MTGPDILFLLALLTVFGIRLGVKLVPNKDVLVFGMVVHHFWFGVLMVLLGWSLPMIPYVSILLIGIGIGLIADHLIYMLLGAGGDEEYWAKGSIIGAVFTLVVIFVLRDEIYRFLLGG